MELTISIPDNKFPFFEVLARELNFVIIEKTGKTKKLDAKQKEWVDGFKTALQEVELHKEYNYTNSIEKQFNELASKWKAEVGLYSLPPKKINETYLKIIAKGEVFLPFILKDIMKGGSVYWHFALKAITGNNEIPDDFSRSKLLKDAWIKWGKDNFII